MSCIVHTSCYKHDLKAAFTPNPDSGPASGQKIVRNGYSGKAEAFILERCRVFERFHSLPLYQLVNVSGPGAGPESGLDVNAA